VAAQIDGDSPTILPQMLKLERPVTGVSRKRMNE
jgi:hypothetical protein